MEGNKRLTQASHHIARKLDKLTTPALRAVQEKLAWLHSEDLVTGERFYLTLDEVAEELKRRDELALTFARELWKEYAPDGSCGKWDSESGSKPGDAYPGAELQARFVRMAEFAIEKYRCLL